VSLLAIAKRSCVVSIVLIIRGVPYNPLLDQGYRSIGDVHSTAKPDPNNISSDAGERSGRWQGKAKSECGLHSNYWEMKKKFEQKEAQ
jgi:phosphoadenosine phosphosulfate reductase